MYRTARITGFRGIRDATVTDLARVNVVVGGAGTGKTALLEALFLHGGTADPRLVHATLGLRGVARSSTAVHGVVRAWDGLFHDRVSSAPVEIDAPWDGVSRITRIERTRADSVEVVTAEGPRVVPVASTLQVELVDGGVSSTHRMHLLRDGSPILVPPPPEPRFHGRMASPTGTVASEEYAQLWSQAEASGDLRPTLEILARLAGGALPKVRIAVDPDARPFLGITLPGGAEASHPSELGMGFARALADLLYVATNPGGALFLDEYDNSVHAAALPELARGVVDAAVAANVQLFVTTHRLEGVDAFLTACVGRSELLRVVQARRGPSGAAYETWTHAEAVEARDVQAFDLRMTR
jgi:hypothetical protein